MIDTKDVDRLEHAALYDRDGNKVGKVEQIYFDDDSGAPSWVTVNTGLFGSSESFVPVQDASFDGEALHVGYDKNLIKDAPRMDADRHLDRSEEDELYRYYGLTAPTGNGHDGEHVRTEHGVRTEHSDEAAVTLSEERLDVDKERVQTGSARLRKYTTTETESVEVPVSKEKLVVERTPATATSTGGHIADEGEQVEEITLSEERVRVEKESVPVEEVRVGKETVTEHEQVTEQVRKEHAEVEGDVDTEGRRGAI